MPHPKAWLTRSSCHRGHIGFATARISASCTGQQAGITSLIRSREDWRMARVTARLMLMLDLVPGRAGESVTDPYYGADDGFAETWADVSAVAAALVAAHAAGDKKAYVTCATALAAEWGKDLSIMFLIERLNDTDKGESYVLS
jgi:hypothetical protein